MHAFRVLIPSLVDIANTEYINIIIGAVMGYG